MRVLPQVTSIMNIPHYAGFSHSVSANGNAAVGIADRMLYLNGRDNSYMYVYFHEGVFDDTLEEFCKLTWDGCAPYGTYNATTRFVFEVYIMRNGDIFLRLLKASSTWNGSFSFNGLTYTINMESPNVSFYALDPNALAHELAYEEYNTAHGYHYEAIFSGMASITNTTTNTSLLNYSTDDGSTTYSFLDYFSWRYNGVDRGYLVISGNAWIGIGSNSEDIRVGRADCNLLSIRSQLGNIALGGVTQKFWKTIWIGGYPYNSATANHIFEVIFFENGDAQITMMAKTATGVYSFLGLSFSIEANQTISFYRQNAEGTSWISATELYDITKTCWLISQ